MKRMIFVAAATLLAAGVLPTASAQSLTVTVDCSRGQTIANALKQGDSRNPLIVVVRGTCNEFVSITRNDVSLRADANVGGRINGPDSTRDTILIAASRTQIDGLTITGGATGIRLQSVFDATVSNTVVEHTADAGLSIRSGYLALSNTTVQYSGGFGLLLDSGASARVVDSRILNNSGGGVSLGANCVLRSTRTTISGNDGRGGVLAQIGAQAQFSGSEISNNGADGISAYIGVGIVVNGGSINRNAGRGVLCNGKCTTQLSGTEILNNGMEGVLLHMDSMLILLLNAPASTVTGNGGGGDVNCYDADSSIRHVQLLIGNVNPNCRAF